jgi:group II intron reverse transcriptase/maturase
MQTSLEAIANKARKEKQYRFRNLYRLINEEILHESWKMLNKKAATGVDGIDYDEYNKNLDANIRILVEKLKQKRYRAKLVRRKYIDKGNGKQRPLGIPATEDKLVQHAAARILSSIYEQEFYPNSYGYRPNRSAQNAIRDLRTLLETKEYRYVVEADIKGYFDNLDHDWLVKMLELRIDDKAFIRLIKKWLKAGVLETDGKVINPISGSPQGGVISPILANIYMHYVIVLWFQKVVKRHCHGKAEVFAYADDFICIFEVAGDAERFYGVLGKRLEKFKLTLSAEKTNIIDFRLINNNSFDFLGFNFRWSKGRWKILRLRTSKKKFMKSYEAFKEWLKGNRSTRKWLLFKTLNQKLRGYYNYYGIRGNSRSIGRFYKMVTEQLFKWLNRRSQRRSYTWEGFRELTEHFGIEKPRVVWA